MKPTSDATTPQRMTRRTHQRCIGCGAVFSVRNVMASTVGLCAECSFRSPYGWRTVYDRERRIGQIPSNLASAR